jgi:hypothetical protein
MPRRTGLVRNPLLVKRFALLALTLRVAWSSEGVIAMMTDNTLTVHLHRRAYASVLPHANLPNVTTVPWWNNRTLRYQIN